MFLIFGRSCLVIISAMLILCTIAMPNHELYHLCMDSDNIGHETKSDKIPFTLTDIGLGCFIFIYGVPIILAGYGFLTTFIWAGYIFFELMAPLSRLFHVKPHFIVVQDIARKSPTASHERDVVNSFRLILGMISAYSVIFMLALVFCA